MAAAEARAAWQRTSRCFVQEDTWRGPKFPGCPSSSSTKSHCDGSLMKDANGHDHSPLFTCSNSNCLSDTKWWLHLQHNFGTKEFTCEQLNVLEANQVFSNTGNDHRCGAKNSGNYKDNESFCAHTGMTNKMDRDARMQDVGTLVGNDPEQQARKEDTGEFCYPNDQLMDLDPLNCYVFEQTKKFSSDLESHLVRAEKASPWWRTAGKDELAFLVAQKSLEHIENCDLPRPQTKPLRKGPSDCLGHFGLEKIMASSVDGKDEMGLLNLTSYSEGIPTSVNSLNNRGDTINKDLEETQNISENFHSKAQLLEALRHSQTRAREAEKVAKEAYTEKEHIIKLLFKQTSHLFAYKLWMQLLQIENLYLQLKNKNQPISSLFPDLLPQVPCNGRQMKGQYKTKHWNHNFQRHEVSNSAVCFAVGLGLAGAGFLLCWTMGWLFPAE